jgi:hypothetical protein
MRRKREIPRRAARLGMTKGEFFRNLFSLRGFVLARNKTRKLKLAPLKP